MRRATLGLSTTSAVAALALTLTACGGDDTTANEPGTLSGDLVGAGASSQREAQAGWQSGFGDVQPNIDVSYEPVGSGSGREQFAAGETAFAASDSAWDRAEDGDVAGNGMCTDDSGLVQVPLYVSPVAVAFKLDGIDTLNLRPEAIAGIFAETVTQWDDPLIARDNPDVALPDLEITTVFRADESGTTGVFTSYLDAVAPEVWTYGETELAPRDLSPETAEGTSGVVGALESEVGSIGYLDASQVAVFGANLGTAAVGVGDGFVPFSPEAAAAIVDASPAVAEPVGDQDLAIDVDYATTNAGTYPIALVSYLIACQRYEDPEVAKRVKAYLRYSASSEGQDAATARAGSAPITDELRTDVLTAVDVIS